MTFVPIDPDSLEEGVVDFEYVNVPVECKECNAITNYHDIEYDTITIVDEEVDVPRCPHCSAHGSFDIELEEFDEVHMI